MEIKIERLDKDLDLPLYGRNGDAGFDLRSSDNILLKPGEKTLVKTGIKIEIPFGYVGLIWDRSGLAHKHHIHTLAGVVDYGYRGEVGVVLRNSGSEDFQVERNMRIAQMIIQPVVNASLIEVDELEDDSERSSGGFGSSGLH
ncbi:dUTP diphosphatase [Candidatus Woesearchaeota archaeon]|nr:dUTP diphosphatase [Candidatus Woesearchaeota archaeon]